MSKTIFLVPGFKTQITDPLYRELLSYLKSKSYTIRPVPITWNNRTVTKNAEEFVNYFEKNKGKVNYVLGFSYGAVISLIVAEKIKPKRLILCSLSPDFTEDSKTMPAWLKKYIGVNRYLDIKTRSAINLAKTLSIETVIFYGEREGTDYPQLKKRCEETAKLAMDSKLVVVKNAPHDISFPTYIAAIKKVI